MQAYRAYYKRGRIVPIGEPAIPEGSELIITVLESGRGQQEDEAPFAAEGNENREETAEEDKRLRLEWLERLHAFLDLAEDEPFDLIPRSTAMREPLILSDLCVS